MPATVDPAAPDFSRLCHVLPRNTNFSAQGATSVDLYVSELVDHSQIDSLIIGAAKSEPMHMERFTRIPEFSFDQSRRQMQFMKSAIRKRPFKTLVVHQHMPSALRINAAASAPVVLLRHNFVKKLDEARFLSGLIKAGKTRSFNQLAGIFFVSETLAQHFERDWPDVTVPRAVIFNGIDPQKWRPGLSRNRDILVVGRAVPEKGILEAAAAVAAVLPEFPGWSATFVLSEPHFNPEYFRKVSAALQPAGPQVKILQNQPLASVKALAETSAVAIIASKWQEPFGRTCLEAHAGGAAVISSGTGGLREISGETAVYIDPNSAASIAHALKNLMGDDALRHSLAIRGKTRVDSLFSLQAIAARFDSSCEDIAAKFYDGKARQLPQT